MRLRVLTTLATVLCLFTGNAWSMNKSHKMLLDCQHSSPNYVGQQGANGSTMLVVDRVSLTAQLDQRSPKEWEPVLQQLDANKISFSLRDDFGPLGFVTVNRRTGGLNGWWAEYKLGYRTVSGHCDIVYLDDDHMSAQAAMDARSLRAASTTRLQTR